MRKKVFVPENVFRSSTKVFFVLLQNRVQATNLFLGGDAQGCGGGPLPLGLLERNIEDS